MKGRKTTVRVGRATQRPDRILADDAYWNVPFLERYLNRCDEVAVHEPAKAYAMAEPVVALADTRITIRERPGAYRNAVEQRTYRVHARMVQASCAKDTGRYAEAETLYIAAFHLASGEIDASIRARLRTSYAWLLVVQGDPAAITEADRALALDVDAVTLASALIVRGAATFHFDDTRKSGLEYFAQAAALAKTERTTKRGQRVFYAALHGLAKVLSDCHPSLSTLRKSYLLLEEVKSYLAGRPRSSAKMQVYRQMGRIACHLGYDRHGPRLIQKARKGFRDLGDPFEFALCSLDLAACLLQSLDLEGYDELVADTHAYLESLDNAELLEALAAWPREVRVSLDELQAARVAIERARDGGP